MMSTKRRKNTASSAHALPANRTTILLAVAAVLVLKAATWFSGYALSFDVGSFNKEEYFGQYHHLRTYNPQTDVRRGFFSLWNYADSEWYLSIAASGYPTRLAAVRALKSPDPGFRSTEHDSVLRYAFFPLYPATIALIKGATGLEPAAFLLTALFGCVAAGVFVTLFKLYFPSQSGRALPALLLLFLYPFSFFYNLYHTESLFLLLSLLCFLACKKEKYEWMAAAGFLLCLTRPNGIFIALPILYAVHRMSRGDAGRPPSGAKAYLCALVIPLGILPYAFLNYRNMRDWFFFATVQQSWGNTVTSTLSNLWTNLAATGYHFISLQFHRFHSSQVDYAVLLLSGAAITAMWLDKRFPREFTLWSTIIWIVPVLSRDLMSFSRYLCVAFPVFMYLGVRLKPKTAVFVMIVFAAGYAWALDRVIRYEWLG
jgi:hypothetical protein